MSLDGFSMHVLTEELRHNLLGARIDRVNQPNKETIVISLRQPGKNFLLQIGVNSTNPGAYIAAKAKENPPEPPVFCMVLRKQLEGGRLTDIRQHGLDRLLLMDIDSLAAGGKIVTKTLALELMGKYSNIILVQDGVIIDALRRIGHNRSRVRTVLPGDAYELPPEQDKLNILTSPLAEIIRRITSQTGVKPQQGILNSCLGFGPVTARETVYLAGLTQKSELDNLTAEEINSLTDALQALQHAADAPEPSLVTDANGKVLAMAAFPIKHVAGRCQKFTAVSELMAAADELTGCYVLPDKDRLLKLVKNEFNRAERKLEKINQEIDEAENADIYKKRGDNLMTYQYELQDHASCVTVTDIYSETGEKIEIPLDPKLTVTQNMQACYKKYDKLKRARSLLAEQRNRNEAEINYLAGIETALKLCDGLTEIGDIQRELATGGYLREKPRKKNNDKPSEPFCFTTPDGSKIWVGKNNYQNDRLSFKLARPTDIWLHTKDIPGSHVILQTGQSEPTEETLLLAAQVAAYFSQAQGSSKVPVDYVPCMHLKKPTGAKPGFVTFTKQHTVYVTAGEDVLAKLTPKTP